MPLIFCAKTAMLFRLMKTKFLLLALLVAFIASGCSFFERINVFKKHKTANPAPTNSPAIVTPDFSVEAKVVSFNSVGRFVVLNFPPGKLPKLQQTFFLYRNDLKVAEVRITGPQEENNIVADLISGDAQSGDDVRDE
jgi:hypothetical protein